MHEVSGRIERVTRALAAVLAPTAPGPSQAQRIAALEARAGRLVERTRLARELHDSVGHVLGLLREAERTDRPAPQRMLRDVDRVVGGPGSASS